jgi:hypothetical protein
VLTLAQAEQFVQKVCMDHRLPAPRITRHTAGTLRRGAKSLHLGHGITREALRDQLAFYLYCRLNVKKRALPNGPSMNKWRAYLENLIQTEFPLPRRGCVPGSAAIEKKQQHLGE